MTYGEMAALGASDFGGICSGCHGANGEGANGPPLIGPASGISLYATVGELYGYISTAMPWDAPGTLASSTYLRITAFLVVKNNFVSPDMIWDPNNLDIPFA